MPRERIPRAARAILKYLKTRAGGSEKKLAAKATAVRKLHNDLGGNSSHAYLTGQRLAAYRAHQLLLQTIHCGQSYPPFALLPLLRGSQKEGQAALWPASQSIRRRYHAKSPCFAACPLYARPQPEPHAALVFPMRMPRKPFVQVKSAAKHKPPSHPLYKYAALGCVQSIHSVTVTEKHGVSGFRGYATLMQPAPAPKVSQQTSHQSWQALQQYANLGKASAANSRREVFTQAGNNRQSLMSYAQLTRRL